jgi:hypothetical protein
VRRYAQGYRVDLDFSQPVSTKTQIGLHHRSGILGEVQMFKVAAIVWIMLATTLAGIAVLILLTVPQLATEPMKAIPMVAIAAAIVAMPLSLWIAWRIQAQTSAK